MRAIMVPAMKPFVSTPIRYDGLGSVIAQQGSSGPTIMIDAHMDELGGMVRRVTPAGFLTMQMLGGWLDQALVDQRWIILGSKGPVHAVTGIRDIHVVPADERTKVYPRNSLFLDIGARNAAEVVAMGVEPGDPVVPDAPFVALNGSDNYLGKAWDDRIGCAVLIEAMRRTAAHAAPQYTGFCGDDSGGDRSARREDSRAGGQAGARDCDRGWDHGRLSRWTSGGVAGETGRGAGVFSLRFEHAAQPQGG